jgi:hypothetical protein
VSQDDAISKLSGESASGVASAVARQALDAPGPSSLYRGVVIDVVHDLAIYDEDQIAELGNIVKDPSLLDMAPRNSCIVQIVTGGQGAREEASCMVCFPFFPPYLGMPVKPGEHVWVFVEDVMQGPSAPLGYWLCRISEPGYVDDINFTHSDRGFSALTSNPDEREMDPPEEDDRGVGFPDGADIPGKTRFRTTGKYDQIYSGSMGMQSVTLEPVPRWTKRPGDLVIMGSNNTLISLGEDRGYTKDDLEEAFAEPPQWSSATNNGPTLAQTLFETPPEDEGPADKNERTFSGTIDIVAGRGKYLEDPDAPNLLTAARTITNSRGFDEVDKNPVGAGNDSDNEANRLANASEGDPDFFNDASRIYVSMNTLPDFNFSIEYPKIPKADDDVNVGNDLTLDAATEPNIFLKEFEDGLGQPAIVIKSDEIRIIARQDLDNEIQGSITLIKEGDVEGDHALEDGTGRAIITIRPDGVILIDGPKIVIGSGNERDPGMGNQVCVGTDATEPMLLGDMFIAAIDKFANALVSDVSTSISNLGAPVIMPQLAAHVAELKVEMDDARSKIAKLR